MSGKNTIRYIGVHSDTHNDHFRPQVSASSIPTQPSCPLPCSNFVGRKEVLSRLKEFFASAGMDSKLFALTGMGGCGKSQVGYEFVHAHALAEQMYDPSMVFFVDGTSTTTLEQSYASIAMFKNVGSTAQDAIRWISSTQESSFTLIDNADGPSTELSTYIPRSTKAHVLITTRLQDMGRRHASTQDAFIILQALPAQDAEELLVRAAMLTPDELEGVPVLVEEISCHALAIAQAGACIAHLHLTAPQYLDRFRRLSSRLLDGAVDGVGRDTLDKYPTSLVASWYTNHEELPLSCKRLLNICAYLHHTGITQRLFQTATDSLKDLDPFTPLSSSEEAAVSLLIELLVSFQDSNGEFDRSAFQKCMEPILALSLIRLDHSTGAYSIPPLIQDCLRSILSDHLPTVFLLALAITAEESDTDFIYHLTPHIEKVMTRMQLADDSADSTHGYHPDVAMAFSLVFIQGGRWGLAESLQRAAASARSEVLGDDDERSLEASSAVVATLVASGQLLEAEVLARSVMQTWVSGHGALYWGTINATHQLSSILASLERHDEAVEVLVEDLNRRRAILGDNSIDIALAMQKLANALSYMDRHEEALKIQLDVLDRYRRLFGEDHPQTIEAMRNLANTLSEFGRHDEAYQTYLQLLHSRQRLLGEDHPVTVSTMQNLASCLTHVGRKKEAYSLRSEVLNRFKSVLGDDHPQTLEAQHDVGIVSVDLGRREVATSILQNREVLPTSLQSTVPESKKKGVRGLIRRILRST